MATMKRRVIYVSDDEWATWQREASEEGRTVSDWIRFHVVSRVVLTNTVSVRGEPIHAVGTTVLNPADRFNTRPFTPVPKHRK